MNRPLLPLLLCALALMPLAAPAQSYWKWRDANGTMQISDQPPPASVPEKNILARPGGRAPVVLIDPEASAAAASAPPRQDAELESRKRKLQAAQAASDAARQQEGKDREQARRDDLCKRIRAQLAALESGVRVVRPNAKGEREYIDDRTRADETRRSRETLAAECP